jgi:transcriptional antiterminator RfaH
MPVLAPEISQFPECLFAEERSPELESRFWWVLHTKPRQEKSLSRQLLHLEVPYYLPLIAKRCAAKDRVLVSQLPLFAGYIFMLGTEEERIASLETKRVVRALPVGDQKMLWHDLGQIHRLIEAGAPITPEDRLCPGMDVEIKSGAFAGMKGKIMRTATGRRFVVQVNFIQRGASVELDDFVLVRAE